MEFYKKFYPKSLLARFIIIITLPVLLAQLVATYIFYERHWQNVSWHMASALAGEMAIMSYLAEHDILYENPKILRLANENLYLRSVFKRGQKLKEEITEFPDSDVKLLYKHLKVTIPNKFNIIYTNRHSDMIIDIQLPNGVLEMNFSSKRLSNPTTYIFILWMVGTTLLLLIVSMIFTRNQIKSIKTLAEAAEHFGKGTSMRFKPTGASEVRKAGFAFIAMKKRIERQIRQRTEMLAGVSHDLKTPLTRMKLQLAMMSGAEVDQLSKDVVLMEKMLFDYLAFAKDDNGEKVVGVNISKLLKEISEEFRDKIEVITSLEADVYLNLREVSFKRAIYNLMENAVRYAQKVHIELNKQSENVLILIEDNGPGIPEEKYQEVFRPFYRIDEARNLEEGSVGLGLAIVKDIITKHGGAIRLSKSSKFGGLLVRILLPF